MFIPARRGVKDCPCATEIAVKILPITILVPTGFVKQCCWYDIVFMMDDECLWKAKSQDGGWAVPVRMVLSFAVGFTISCYINTTVPAMSQSHEP